MLGPVTGDALAQFLQCVCACVHQHISTYMYASVHFCVYVCYVHVHMNVSVFACVCLCVHLCIYMCACLCMCINMCVHVCTSGVVQYKYYLSFQLKIIVGRKKKCSEPCDHTRTICMAALRFSSHSWAEKCSSPQPPSVMGPLPPLRVTLVRHCFSARQAHTPVSFPHPKS